MRIRGFILLCAGVLGAATLAANGQVALGTASPVVNIPLATSGTMGGNPYNGFVQASDGNIYGTAQCGGQDSLSNQQCSGNLDTGAGGVLFSISPNFTYTVLHTFTGGTDGAVPQGLVEAPDGNLYGICTWGGANGVGTLFRWSLSSGTLTTLSAFSGTAGQSNPLGSLIYGSDGYLYGATANFYSNTGYGIVFRATTSGTITSLFQFGTSGATSGGQTAAQFGTYAWDGVTQVGTKLYGVSRFTQTGQVGDGVLWYVNSNAPGTGTVLHSFTNGNDGSQPQARPRLYSDGELYGTTDQGNGYNGALYNYIPGEDFYTLYDDTRHPLGGVTFIGGNSLLYTDSDNGGDGYMVEGTTAALQPSFATVYSYPSADAYTPDSTPFIDNQGNVWSEQVFGPSTAPFGAITAISFSTGVTSPVTISASATTVQAGGLVSLTWKATNLFSSNEQLCFATASPAVSGWSGVQAATYANGVYSSSKAVSVTLSTAGTYSFAITCGGYETALATVTVPATAVATTTTLTATPNPVGAGQNVTLSAAVKKNSGSGIPTGSVTFKTGSTTLATIPLNSSGVANLTAAANYPNGSYPVTAYYNGDSADTASVSNTVNISIVYAGKETFTITPSSVTAGSNVTLSVKVTGGGATPTGTVTFSVGATKLFSASLTSGAITQSVSSKGYPAGTYTVTAAYGGDATHSAATANATVTLTN